MDLSYWNKVNPSIVYEATRKQFYNRFCYKLVLQAYCGRIINDKGTVAHELDTRRKINETRRYNYGGSWFHRYDDKVELADPDQLETLRSIRNGYGNAIKMRVEEPWVQIYAKDEATLKDIANRFTPSQQAHISSISLPASADDQTLLEDGKIIVRSVDNIGYKYKVFFRDGNYSNEAKLAVYNYLMGVEKDVKVSVGTKAMLTNGHGFIWNCFIYVNDPAILTMLTLIAPGMVGKIHELVDKAN